jgi:hypothetical protein
VDCIGAGEGVGVKVAVRVEVGVGDCVVIASAEFAGVAVTMIGVGGAACSICHAYTPIPISKNNPI